MMAEPNSSTLESVGFFVYYMSPKALENPSSLDAATCGTGPFQLSEFENNAYAIYTKNENYWKEGLPYLDSVEVTLVTESSTANTAFQANEYDMYWVGLANLHRSCSSWTVQASTSRKITRTAWVSRVWV